MAGLPPILELQDAKPGRLPDAVIHAPLELTMVRGEFALIECWNPEAAGHFADICCGLQPLERGAARFVGLDWARVPDTESSAMRGRIGRVFHDVNWIPFLDMESNILLSQRHHTRRSLPDLRARAAALAVEFGLPGLPAGSPSRLSPGDLVRAACVRAFLGEPLLILLEFAVHSEHADLIAPLINAISHARNRGAAVIWLTESDAVWRDPSLPATQRLRLSEEGLTRPQRPS